MNAKVAARETVDDALRELAAARDEARVKAHLFSLEAKQRLGQLESNFRQLEQKLGGNGERAVESVIGVARELTHAIRGLLREGAENATLSTPVSVVMTRSVRTCTPRDTLARAAELMWEADCGCLPVIADDRRLVGMITDRDVCMGAYLQHAALTECKVGASMSREVAFISSEEPVRVAAEVMRKKQVRRVPVVDSEGKLVGIISLADLAHLEPAQPWLSQTVTGICERRGSGMERRI